MQASALQHHADIFIARRYFIAAQSAARLFRSGTDTAIA
jgi:hypothetical protein